jgi:uncharacterized protein
MTPTEIAEARRPANELDTEGEHARKLRFRRLFAGGFLAFALFGVAAAGPLEDGTMEYQRGHNAAAMRLWRPLADQGNAQAQSNLGWMYEHGESVPQDYAQSVAWYRKGADQGNALGQLGLGGKYEQGQGVPEDFVQAYMWFDLAAVRGELAAIPNADLSAMRDKAAKERDAVAAQMTPEQIAEAKRLAKAWMQSHPSTP